MPLHRLMLSAAAMTLGLAAPALAQEEFFLTYHVERTDAAALSIESCGQIAADAARAAGLSADTTSFPGQLVTVSGGAKSVGTFVVQCITVDAKTVTVVQGIDYQQTKGQIGSFADQTFAAIIPR